MPETNEDTLQYAVVLNDEEQYSIWPHHREPPAGWKRVGTTGSKQQCLEYIKSAWTDMRPRSLREAMANQSR
jgi:MbtH protein